MRFWDYPIQRKLMLIITLTSVLALTLAGAAFFCFEVLFHAEGMKRGLAIRARDLGADTNAALIGESRRHAEEALAAVALDPRIVAAFVYAGDGRLFASYRRRGETGEPPARPGPDGARFGRGRLTAVQGAFMAGRRVGTVVLAQDLRDLYRELWGVLGITFSVLLAASIAAYALAAKFQRLVSGPILELSRAARVISRAGDYSARPAKRGDDELGRLVDDFNEMLDRLQKRDLELRRLNETLEERVRERTANLEASNKELEAFSYSVSHDLRAPLRAIDGFSLAVLEDYAEKLDDRGRDYLRRIRAATQRMSAIIDDMLTLGRVTRSELHREKVDLSQLAGQVAAELQVRQPQRQATFEIDPGVRAWGDAHLLRLALENLLGNAWKFTGKTTHARIEFRVIEREGRPVYLVRDNGAGFDQAYAGRLFKPFVRLHAASEFPGTGVGLAIVTRILQRHGGRIWAEGATGKGAAFYFTVGEKEP